MQLPTFVISPKCNIHGVIGVTHFTAFTEYNNIRHLAFFNNTTITTLNNIHSVTLKFVSFIGTKCNLRKRYVLKQMFITGNGMYACVYNERFEKIPLPVNTLNVHFANKKPIQWFGWICSYKVFQGEVKRIFLIICVKCSFLKTHVHF